MIKVNFTSGKSLELEEGEDQKFLRNIKLRGNIRYYETMAGHLIPLNSQTIELVEIMKDPTDALIDTLPVEIEVDEEKLNESMETPVPEMDEMNKQEAPKTKTQDELLEEMRKRSDCNHEGLLQMCVSETKQGRRYFPVCSFCGHRMRYVGKQKVAEGKDPNWTIEDLRNAKSYVEK
jgi:hypothetical protein